MFNEQKITVYAVNPTAIWIVSWFPLSLSFPFIQKKSFERERSDWKSQYPSEGYVGVVLEAASSSAFEIPSRLCPI